MDDGKSAASKSEGFHTKYFDINFFSELLTFSEYLFSKEINLMEDQVKKLKTG